MEEPSILQTLRDLLKNIQGHWHSAAADHHLVLDACDRASQTSTAVVKSSQERPLQCPYNVCSYLNNNLEAVYYLELGQSWDTKRWYKITGTSPDTLVLVEIEKAVGRKELGEPRTYQKKNDKRVIDEMLKAAKTTQ